MPRPPDKATLERLKQIVGPAGWSEDQDTLAPHLVEWRSRFQGKTPLMLKPASIAEAGDDWISLKRIGAVLNLMFPQEPEDECGIPGCRECKRRSQSPLTGLPFLALCLPGIPALRRAKMRAGTPPSRATFRPCLRHAQEMQKLKAAGRKSRHI